ncbi:MAG: META domain-containing protein [Candidatus Pseudobacter hemicellulosilyticus]|uniref:META domain-containing protein n=1 Tax=Candidatus Pseudobacter hemicellulosilyticus TaxID=3121375 RepID=A0AAJ5WQ77_9BACT|nr:MAG: META domain-containing protein [Pseudobacter sp.]
MKMGLLVWAGISACWLTACNNNVPPAGSSSPLEGTTWKLTGLSSLPEGLPALPQDVTLRMDTGRVTGHAGCNRYFGTYTLSGASLQFNGVGSTKMFCDAAMKVEEGLLQSISNTGSYHVQESGMVLLKGSDTLARFTVLRDTAQ